MGEGMCDASLFEVAKVCWLLFFIRINVITIYSVTIHANQFCFVCEGKPIYDQRWYHSPFVLVNNVVWVKVMLSMITISITHYFCWSILLFGGICCFV